MMLPNRFPLASLLRMAACFALIACPANLPAQAAAAPAPRAAIPLETRARTFDAVWRKVNDTFWDRSFGGHDWRAIGERYRPLALAEADSIRFHALLARMVQELGYSHFNVLSPEAIALARQRARTNRYGTGLDVRMIAGEAIVTRVDGAPLAADARIRPGQVITAIDGHRIEAVMTTAHVREMLRGPAGSECTLDVLDGAGRPVRITTKRSPLPGAFYPVTVFGVRVAAAPEQYAELEARTLRGGIGYLRLSRFVTGILPELASRMRGFASARGLILDLRGNPGGEDEVARRLAEMLVDRPGTLMVTRTRRGLRSYRLKPASAPYRGPLAILLDADSGSASEQMAAGLQEMGRARIVGERSEGHDVDADILRLPSGGALIYGAGLPMTPRGVIIEGRGVLPDLPVPLTRAAAASGRDVQLEAALGLVERLAADVR